MPMDDVAKGAMLGTRSLAMEILSTLPPGGNRRYDNSRQVWERGASLVELGKDFGLSTDSIRVIVKELGALYAVRTGNVAPVMLPTGQWIRGGHCAFIEAVDCDDPRWAHVQQVCEDYQNEYDDG